MTSGIARDGAPTQPSVKNLLLTSNLHQSPLPLSYYYHQSWVTGSPRCCCSTNIPNTAQPPEKHPLPARGCQPFPLLLLLLTLTVTWVYPLDLDGK